MASMAFQSGLLSHPNVQVVSRMELSRPRDKIINTTAKPSLMKVMHEY